MRAEYRKCSRVIKQRVFRKARKDTWNKFVNLLNFRTPTKKVWDKFKEVKGNYIHRTKSPLERGGNTYTSTDEIADHYANILRVPYKKNKPGKHRKRKKEEDLSYNKPFTDRELKQVIKKQKNNVYGENTIHPQMIKRLPPEILKYLLDMYNKVLEREKYQNPENMIQ